MAAINSFEELLQFDNNTVVLKFYMHISKDIQLKELKERLEDPAKIGSTIQEIGKKGSFGTNTWQLMNML